MKQRYFNHARASIYAMLCAVTLLSYPAFGQQSLYHNIVNQHFRTISNGPQSALILDVKSGDDVDSIRASARKMYNQTLKIQGSALQREIQIMRQRHLIGPTQPLGLADAVIVRRDGRLAQFPKGSVHTRGGGSLTFTFPTDTTVTGHWSAADAVKLSNLANTTLYPELKAIIGDPGWTGTVPVLNLDPRLGKGDEVLGALLIIDAGTGNVSIDFPTFGDNQTQFLAMAQAMAQAFHAKSRIAYDAWEQGFARAAATIAAQDIHNFLGTDLDPSNGFYYTPNYDLMNQPPLANNTFTPPTKSNQAFNSATLSGMLIPRIQMASSAWLKCYIENHSFFQQFNDAYYAAFAADPSIANDVNRLRAIAKIQLPTIELQDFDRWFEQQHVLDTSITVGNKLYIVAQPTFPTGTQSGNDSGAVFYGIYYTTTPTGDESDLSGTSKVIYWDFNFQNRLFLPSFETLNIVSGFGSVAPFFTNIGGNPADKMRVAADFPLNKEYARVYFPAGQTGTITAPNNFSGVLVGADSGNLNVGFDNNATATLSPAQGEFGGKTNVPSGFTRVRLTLTPTGSSSAISYQRNVYIRPDSIAVQGVEPIFQLVVPSPTVTLSHTFPGGPQMISLPVKPLVGNLAPVLGVDPKTLLLAQYRQDISAPPATDKYYRYPTLPTYQPGFGLWASFNGGGIIASNIKGESQDNQQDISVPIEFGWNQIGSPYSSGNLNINTDLFIEYQGTEVVSLQEAINRGYVAVGIIGFSQTTGYNDITTTTDLSFPKNTLEPWKGYWIRVMVTEGVTLTYLNPNYVSRAAKFRSRASSTPKDTSAWRLPLIVRDEAGNSTGAVLGQSSNGSDGFTSALDVAEPPPFTRAASLSVRFPHADWNTGTGGSGGNFLTDIRRSSSKAQWEAVVNVPAGEQNYSLNWSETALLPRGTRLTLIDMTSGVRQAMNTTSGYSFRPGKNELTRRFQIVAEPRATGHLFIRNVHVDSTGGRASGINSVAISYELTTEAETSIDILLGGRTVRRITSGRAASVGVNQAIWDMKDNQGRGMPSGTYLLQVTARSQDGDKTRQVFPIIISR